MSIRQDIQKLTAITKARASNNVMLESKYVSNIFVAEVMNPSDYGLTYAPVAYVYCRRLYGWTMDMTDEDYPFLAKILGTATYAVGELVFILQSGEYPFLVLASAGGGASVTLGPHSHQGYYDGGWAGFLSGGL